MADEILTIAGAHKKAISDGTALRKESKKLSGKVFWVVIIGVLVAFFVWYGYQIFGYESSNEEARRPPATNNGPVEVPDTNWSAPIKVGAGDWSSEVWVEAKNCFEPQILEGGESTTKWFRAHSRILPWKSAQWKANDGGEFRGIKLGGATEPFSFRYRVLKSRC